MHKKLIKKYQFGGYVPGITPSVYNASMGLMSSTPGYIPTGSTGVNSGIGEIMKSAAVGQAIAQGGSIAGLMMGGETGNIIGTVAGNLGSNILSAGSISGGLKNFSKFNVKGFGTKDFKGFGNLGNLAGGIATGILDRSASHQRTSGKYGTIAAGTDMIGGLIGNLGHFGGYGILGSLGMAAANKLTGGTDGMTIADSLLGSSSLAGGLTAINPIAGAAYVGLSALNSATGKTTTENAYKDFMSRELLDPLWASYSKSFGDHKNALKYGGKKYGGLSVLTGSYGKANRKVRNDNSRLDTMMDIADRRELGQIRGEQMADINALDYRLNTFGGYDLYGTRVGRKGMKLPTKKEILKIKSILEYKKGGQMNVIPEGALHARKNHMEGAGKDFTHKGIPVMDKDGEQQAEIERDEIIFSLRVTQKLERLKNDGSDEAAIKAGKLLVDEIFHNTDDRTGLIAEVIGLNTTVLKEGGVLLAQEPEIESKIEVEEPVGMEEVEYYESGGVLEEGDNAISAEEPEIYNDDVEEFLKGGKTIKHWKKPDNWTDNKIPYEEWVKDVNPYFLSENYDLRSAYENYPKEQLERWKWSTNLENPDVYLNYNENGYYPYHLGSVVELPNGDYKFLKLGRIEENPELIHELWGYKTNENGLANTHDLNFEGDRYYYRKKKSFKKKDGGTIEQLTIYPQINYRNLNTL